MRYSIIGPPFLKHEPFLNYTVVLGFDTGIVKEKTKIERYDCKQGVLKENLMSGYFLKIFVHKN
jgi:hypothetical protein